MNYDENDNDLGIALIKYIEENNLLYGFNKLEVFDTMTYKEEKKHYETDYSTPLGPGKRDRDEDIEYLEIETVSYIYNQRRTYRFKIGDAEYDVHVDHGNFSIPEPSYGYDEYKVEYKEIAEIINFLRTDTRLCPSIVAFLAQLLKIDMEKILHEYTIQKKKRGIRYKIDVINSKIYELEKAKEELEKELAEMKSAKMK